LSPKARAEVVSNIAALIRIFMSFSPVFRFTNVADDTVLMVNPGHLPLSRYSGRGQG
jgi:hypothetical protein